MSDLVCLTRLIETQFATVPFENVTSLERRLAFGPVGDVPAIDLAQLQANWDAKSGGGVCYEIATVFHNRALELGFESRQILATISSPDGHMAAVTTVSGREYLVDVGTGSPVFQAIPLDCETSIVAAGLPFRFRPDPEPGFFLQERLFDGEWTISTRYDLAHMDEKRRFAAYQRHHRYGESWVVDRLRMVKWVGDEVCYSITGNELTTITTDGKELRVLQSVDELEQVVGDVFGVPGLPIREAVSAHPSFFA